MAATDDRLSTQGSPGARAAGGRSSHRWLTQAVIWVVLVVGAVLMMLPLLWMVSSSFKLQQRVFQMPPQLIPNPFRPQNYVEALTYKPFHIYFRNTAFIVAMHEIAVLWAASFCAYGFARMRFVGRELWFGVVLATMMVPYAVMLVPNFVIFTGLHWIDTFLPLIVPPFFGGGAFYIFLLRQFFRTIPEELADAARIDGCNEFAIYARIMMPLAKPALTTVAIFTFIGAWNDFMGPLLYLNSPEKSTVSIGLSAFRSVLNTRWDLLMAASTATTLPIIIVFFMAQRYFVQGVVMTGLKG